MDGIIEAVPHGDDGNEAVQPGSVDVLVEGEGLTAVEVVTIRHGDRLRKIVELIALRSGFEHEEALLFIEDESEPLDLESIIDARHPVHRKHHVHRARSLEVVVHYTRTIERQYPPSARVETVLAWAVKELGIDPAMATEFELAVVGSEDELPGSEHIGRLVAHPACRIEFNLIRGVIPNGSSA